MNRRLLLVAMVMIGSATAAPNIVVVMTDDQGYGDFGFVGNQIFRTPHIDQMASESSQIAQFYVSPVCSPTRACLMTGRYNYRTRAIDTFKGRSMMEPGEVTIAEDLAEAGYGTGLFGKWHLGDNYPLRPQDQGFEEVLMHAGGGLAQNSEPIENARRYTDPILFHNGEQVQTKGYCTNVYFDGAFDWMEKCVAAGRPFFTYIALNAPHGPYHDVPSDLLAEYLAKPEKLKSLMRQRGDLLKKTGPDNLNKIEMLAAIAAMVTNADENMGRLFAKLDTLKVTEDTLVIFLTDNGPNTPRYVGPFRGNKTQVLEGGIRTVFLAKWPAKLPAGHISNGMGAHIDIAPTLLTAAGVKPSPKRAGLFDGRDLMPLLTGEVKGQDFAPRTITLQSHRGNVPVRYHNFMTRDHLGWKLVNPSGFSRETLPEGEPQLELYDLNVDPSEANDLAEKRPEIVERLKKAYNAWFDSVSSTRPDNYEPPRITLGSEHERSTVLTAQDLRVDDEGNPIGWLVDVKTAGRYQMEFMEVESVPDNGFYEVSSSRGAGHVTGSDNSVFANLKQGEQLLSPQIKIEGAKKPRFAYQLRVSLD